MQQRRERAHGEDGSGGDLWEDIATVTVPTRTKRNTVIAQALAKGEIGTDVIRVRVLNAESAHVSTVQMEQPDPQLRIT